MPLSASLNELNGVQPLPENTSPRYLIKNHSDAIVGNNVFTPYVQLNGTETGNGYRDSGTDDIDLANCGIQAGRQYLDASMVRRKRDFDRLPNYAVSADAAGINASGVKLVTFEENLLTPPFNDFGEESMRDLLSYSWFRGCTSAIPHVNSCTVEIKLSEKLASHLLEMRNANHSLM